MEIYRALTILVLLAHAGWILWVLLGWLLTRGRALLRWLHIGSLVYAIGIEVFLWPCPLTIAEQWLRRRAGLGTYQESFLMHYLDAIIYPDVSQALISWCAVAVCGAILVVYVLRFRRRGPAGW